MFLFLNFKWFTPHASEKEKVLILWNYLNSVPVSRNGSFYILVLYFDSKVDVINSMFCTLAKYQKWIFQAWWVQSNIKTSIYHQYLYISEKPTWTEVDIDHDTSTHRKSVWGQEKKIPPRDLQFPQSPVNPNISTKWSGSQGQRRRLYLHKSWEESSQEKLECP